MYYSDFSGVPSDFILIDYEIEELVPITLLPISLWFHIPLSQMAMYLIFLLPLISFQLYFYWSFGLLYLYLFIF